MYRYFQKAETDAWRVLPLKPGEDPVSLALSFGAKKLTILSINQMVADGDDEGVERNRDLLSYRGPMYFDIDCKDDLATAISSGVELVQRLLALGTPEAGIQVFLSGSKGLHILLDERLFCSGRFTRRLPEIYKEMALSLFVPGVDFSVYSGGRGNSFRIANIERFDGNYRVPITLTELRAVTPEQYRELVRTPRIIPEPALPDGHVPELVALYEDAKKRVNSKIKVITVTTSKELEKIKHEPPACIQALCNGKDLKTEANFNQIATQLACYIERAGVEPMVADALASRCADNVKSSKFSTVKLRRDHIEAQRRYMEHTKSFSFGCNAIRALLSKRPCEGCALEHSSGGEDEVDTNICAEACADGYYVRAGEGRRRITNFTLSPTDVFIDKPQDGTSARRMGTRMAVIQDGVEVGAILFKETSFNGRAGFLREIEGVSDLTFQGSDLEVQKIKMAIYRDDQDMGEVFQVYTAGIHLDFIGDTPIFTYVEPDLSINSVKVRGTHQFLGTMQARPYFSKVGMPAAGDDITDQAITAMLRMNRAYEIGMIVGWCAACHLREHLQYLYNQFPVLSLWGSAGAGKSITAGLVTWINGTDYMSLDSGANAPSATPWSMLEYCSSTTTVPRIIEEYNKSKMAPAAYRETGERIKQSWGRESAMRGRPGSKSMSRVSAETVVIPVSSPLIVMSEQEIEMPALQERSIRIHLTKAKRAGRREDFEFARKHRVALRSFGKALMANALNTTLEEVSEMMEQASDLLPERMDDRPRYSMQVAIVGMWNLRKVLASLKLVKAYSLLDQIIGEILASVSAVKLDSDGDYQHGYVQSEIDLVIQKIGLVIAISRSADESGTGRVYLREGMQYAVNSQYLIIDPVLCHAAYTNYTSLDERATPVIASAAQFLRLVAEEPYFVAMRPFEGMGGGRQMLFLDIQEMANKLIDTSLFAEVPHANSYTG